jgi:tetratricopeptide (TPR) repeat protein
MIKHYFSKANTKAMLGRYDEAIKDYTNAVIVYKEQVKNENSPEKTMSPGKKIKKGASDDSDEYYQEKQIMFNEIYLNRAIAYIK